MHEPPVIELQPWAMPGIVDIRAFLLPTLWPLWFPCI
jgi:hypothetical protein